MAKRSAMSEFMAQLPQLFMQYRIAAQQAEREEKRLDIQQEQFDLNLQMNANLKLLEYRDRQYQTNLNAFNKLEQQFIKTEDDLETILGDTEFVERLEGIDELYQTQGGAELPQGLADNALGALDWLVNKSADELEESYKQKANAELRLEQIKKVRTNISSLHRHAQDVAPWLAGNEYQIDQDDLAKYFEENLTYDSQAPGYKEDLLGNRDKYDINSANYEYYKCIPNILNHTVYRAVFCHGLG